MGRLNVVACFLFYTVLLCVAFVVALSLLPDDFDRRIDKMATGRFAKVAHAIAAASCVVLPARHRALDQRGVRIAELDLVQQGADLARQHHTRAQPFSHDAAT